MTSPLETILESEFNKLLLEHELYEGKGSGRSGFALHGLLLQIDGLLLNINKYRPIGGSSTMKNVFNIVFYQNTSLHQIRDG